MNRALAVLATFALVVTLTACTLLVSTSNLVGGAGTSETSPAASVIDGGAALGASCRAIHDRLGDAGSGSYTLTSDGGATVQAHCDMESYGGGWTLVTPAMIVEDKASQDYAPGSPGMVTVSRSADANGGLALTLLLTKQNCGAKSNQVSPGHYFLAGELDGWTQMMATYEFSNSVSCWHVFGDVQGDGRDTNILPFDLTLDQIGPQENMSRTLARAPIPFDGKTYRCSEDADNFWAGAYAGQRKSARVVVRRNKQGKPAGLAVGVDCGMPAWTVSDIYVR